MDTSALIKLMKWTGESIWPGILRPPFRAPISPGNEARLGDTWPWRFRRGASIARGDKAGWSGWSTVGQLGYPSTDYLVTWIYLDSWMDPKLQALQGNLVINIDKPGNSSVFSPHFPTHIGNSSATSWNECLQGIRRQHMRRRLGLRMMDDFPTKTVHSRFPNQPCLILQFNFV